MDKPFQYELMLTGPRRDLHTLWMQLNMGSRLPVAVTLTRNRVTMCSVTNGSDGRVRVRLHEAFLEAPDDVIEALRRYIVTGHSHDWKQVSTFALHICPESDCITERTATPCQAGRVHDLQAIAASVNREYFNNRVEFRIEWGRGRPARSRRRKRVHTIRFGTWIPASRLVRIHPLLDDARVSATFIAYIVFHELLHAVVPRRMINGRCYDHTPEFRRLERGFAEFGNMQRLSRELVDILL